MRSNTLYAQFGPEFTSKAMRYLLIATGAISLICALLHPLFSQVFGIHSPFDWLALSVYGISHYYIWQPLTYALVQDGSAYGITLSYLINLTFTLYLLWVLGSTIIEKIGEQAFLIFYFATAAICGLITLLPMSLWGASGSLAGPMPVLLALFVIWACLYAESEILLFFIFPIKTKWLLAGVVLAFVLVNLSQADGMAFLFYGSGLLMGYLYAVTVLGLRTPFPWTHAVDDTLTIWYDKGMGYFRKWNKKNRPNTLKSKIFDFKTGKPVFDDDQFIDAMLTKISRSGEKSLTAGERRRMREISENKKQQSR